ncbi:MAG TPA: imidazolonepropionase [Trueperaceae bacterium]|nr:imidazolonepropionase [Trueperaceae bacterium]
MSNEGTQVKGISELFTPYEAVPNAAMAIVDGHVAWVGAEAALPSAYAAWPSVDLGGNAVIPGLVDSHTHLIWAGDRLDEYLLRARGASYPEILAAGKGIYETVAATRSASEASLLLSARRRAGAFLRSGVTALEIKSGYSLDTEGELRMLRVARQLGEEGPQRVTTTLLAHVRDKDVPRETYLATFLSETLPEAVRLGLVDAVDVFCDEGAFTLTETRRILEAALTYRLKIKAHAEQLTHTGAARLVAELGGVSADHLELASAEDLGAMAAAGSVATFLPDAALLLRRGTPDWATVRASGVRVAVASDHNPGSSPVYGLMLALNLAVATLGMSVEEALVAGTANAGLALGQPTWGTLAPGSVADYLVVDSPRALTPFYTWGSPSLREMVIGGNTVWRKDG